MNATDRPREELLAENEYLRLRLEEAEETLRAIGSGEVDAFVVSGADGEQVFTLKGAERPYRVLVETMNEGAATLATDGTILYCNKRLAAMLQAPPELLIGTQLGSYVSPPDRSSFAARLEKCAQECNSDEIDLVSGAGNCVPVLMSSCTLDLANERVISLVVTDLTQQKRNEETMAAERLARSIIEQAGEAIIVCDDAGVIIRASRLAYELCGSNPLLKPFDELYPLRVAESGCPFSVMAPMRGDVFDCVEVEFTRSDERIYHLLLNASPLKYNPNLIHGCVLTLTDFTERKQAEAALKRMNEELEERVAQRTRELREKDQVLLLQSRQAAMGEMIGNIAHQWRQPLNTLGLVIQQLELFYDLGAFSKDFLQKSASHAMNLIQHMSQTIDDFRDYFRPDKELSEFKASEAIASTLSLLDDSFKNLHIDVDVITKSDPVINGYRNEFAQVLLNILTNAKDALVEMKIEKPRVTITIGAEDGRAVLTVADNAGGIPVGILGKVFDPYFTTKGPQQGTGVGLFMSKTIIEKNMNGKLSVRNDVEGAVFRIEMCPGIL